jgi:hypothetical protein
MKVRLRVHSQALIVHMLTMILLSSARLLLLLCARVLQDEDVYRKVRW